MGEIWKKTSGFLWRKLKRILNVVKNIRNNKNHNFQEIKNKDCKILTDNFYSKNCLQMKKINSNIEDTPLRCNRGNYSYDWGSWRSN